MTKKSNAKKDAKDVTFNMTAAVPGLLPSAAAQAAADDAVLNNLLDELGGEETIEGDGSSPDEGGVIEPTLLAADESLLAEVIEDAERTSATHAIYASQTPEEIADGQAPATDPDAIASDAPAAAGKKRKGIKKAKAAGEAKQPRATSVTHKPGDLLMARLGENAKDFLVFSMTAADTLDEDGLKALQASFIDRMNDPNAIADKVREKISMFLVWLKKGGEPNEIIKRALTVLVTEGQLTSGDKGNLQQNLLTKPYSIGTARSQANQMFMVFPELGLTIKEKGKMIPNPDSALLPIAKAMLGL